jgi:hypothetical protein
MSFLRPFESAIGMFHCLLGVLVSGLVIFFFMVHGGGAVRVCREFMRVSGSLMCVIWHSISRPPVCSNLAGLRLIASYRRGTNVGVARRFHLCELKGVHHGHPRAHP